jgi:hypothetical protein
MLLGAVSVTSGGHHCGRVQSLRSDRSPDQVDFPYPLLVSSMGLVFAAITTHTMKALGHLTLEYEDHVTQKFWLSKCLPVGICHAATLAFGNAQYMHSGMALIQFMKSFTPCITAIVTFFLLNRRESYAVPAPPEPRRCPAPPPPGSCGAAA